jgi:hypothetical protein
MRFPFDFEPGYRLAALLFAVTPGRAWVDVGDDELSARFGLWRLSTPLANVVGTQVTGPYAMLKTIGPAHLSLVDRGLTFATNGRRGLCISFARPVTGLDPTGRLRHPGLTVTVADVDGLAEAVARSRPRPPPP